MDWLSGILEFAVKLGITSAAIAAALWALVRFAGQKWIGLYFDKQQESFKQALSSHYNTQLETHKAEQQKSVEDQKGYVQQRVEITKSMLAAGLEDTKAKQQMNLEQTKADLDQRKQLMQAQITSQMEALKAGLDLDSKSRLAVSERRLGPYKELWSLMEPLSPGSDKALDRSALEAAFRKWFYAFGNGLFLSWEALDAYLLATNLLKRNPTEVPDDTVRAAFSGLRTQMKIDIAVYTTDEGAARVG
jgi:hypothetical protein